MREAKIINMNTKKIISKVILYLIVVSLSVVFVFPFIWMFRSSFMNIGQIFRMPPEWIPNPFSLDGYKETVLETPLFRYALNTLIILIFGTIGTLLTASMAAYAFSRVVWRGRDLIFSIILSSMMLPTFVTLIPQFTMWNSLGLYDTFAPLIIPGFLGGGAFNIFLLRQFFMTIPRELDESAFIDGATHLQVFTKIMIPLCKSSFVVVGIFSFIFYWNDFFNPLIYLSSSQHFTLSIGLQQMIGQYSTKWDVLMAASTIVLVPCLLVFSFGQKYLLEGIAMTGIKG